ncbi:MAG: GT4 family glycosyltransferase PelF [Acidobacteriia bacterium]|nr:GT4 family glycosyltransferase PelF [Terriglobia bacterium]
MNFSGTSDICLILEGTYPYVAGGVSSWAHQLILAQSHLSFELVCLMPEKADLTLRYPLPPNVVRVTNIPVGVLPAGEARLRGTRGLMERLERPLLALQSGGGLAELIAILQEFRPIRSKLGRRVLLNSPEAWELTLRMYEKTQAESAFLDYFWSWRTIFGGLYSMLLCELPQARVYHALSTGYAGLFASRAHLETGRPVLLTEHGIYTNERRIEIAMADWLYQPPETALNIEKSPRDLRPMWFDAFRAYSRACYQASSRIITLYSGNQQFQLADGAPPEKLQIIPNGIDCWRFSNLSAARSSHPPTIALIGRVVPIKDIKTFIRATAILREILPELQSLVLGPADEDPSYLAECKVLVNHLGLEGCLKFVGPVSVPDHLPQLDVVVLTSISEAQPLVILEAGAAGVPCVATDVGACREMIYGAPGENPCLGAGGEVTPLANPTATAHALARLLLDPGYWESASRTLQERVRRYYDRAALDRSYRDLYEYWRAAPSSGAWGEAA